MPWVAPKPLLRSPDIQTWLSAVSYMNHKWYQQIRESPKYKNFCQAFRRTQVGHPDLQKIHEALHSCSLIRTNFIRSDHNSLSIPNTPFNDQPLSIRINQLLLRGNFLTNIFFNNKPIFRNRGYESPRSICRSAQQISFRNRPNNTPIHFSIPLLVKITPFFGNGAPHNIRNRARERSHLWSFWNRETAIAIL